MAPLNGGGVLGDAVALGAEVAGIAGFGGVERGRQRRKSQRAHERQSDLREILSRITEVPLEEMNCLRTSSYAAGLSGPTTKNGSEGSKGAAAASFRKWRGRRGNDESN